MRKITLRYPSINRPIYHLFPRNMIHSLSIFSLFPPISHTFQNRRNICLVLIPLNVSLIIYITIWITFELSVFSCCNVLIVLYHTISYFLFRYKLISRSTLRNQFILQADLFLAKLIYEFIWVLQLLFSRSVYQLVGKKDIFFDVSITSNCVTLLGFLNF